MPLPLSRPVTNLYYGLRAISAPMSAFALYYLGIATIACVFVLSEIFNLRRQAQPQLVIEGTNPHHGISPSKFKVYLIALMALVLLVVTIAIVALLAMN